MPQPLALIIPVATSFPSHPSPSSLISWAAVRDTKVVLCCALQYGVLDLESVVFDDLTEEVEENNMTCISITVCIHKIFAS